MLSYMLPVEEKQPSASAAAARNLSLNLTTTTTGGGVGGAGGGGAGVAIANNQLTSTPGLPGAVDSVTAAVCSSASQVVAGAGAGGSASAVVTRSIIKPTIKHNASHRYQLISGTADATGGVGAAKKRLGREHQQSKQQQVPLPQPTVATGSADARLQPHQQRWKEDADLADQCDESTNLLSREPGEAEDFDDDENDDDDGDGGDKRHGHIGGRPVLRATPGADRSLVKSDKNFNNLILVTNGKVGKGAATSSANGGQCRMSQAGNGNHATSVKLASVLKHTNGARGAGGGVASGSSTTSSSSSSNASNGGTGSFYNGYIAVSSENDDEHHRLLVSANNLRNSGVLDQSQQQQQSQWCRTGNQPLAIGDYDVDDLVLGAGGPATDLLVHASSNSSNSSNSSSRAMNSLNGNLSTGRGEGAEVMDLSASARDAVCAAGGDASVGSDSDSVTGGGSISGAGGVGVLGAGTAAASTVSKKVKLNKLGGNKNVTLKRVSFGSSKGSMVETLVFETPTPLPEHAEREFFQSPAVLAGAGHTTMYSAAGGGAPGAAPHHHYPASQAYHHHHHHHHAAQQHQYHQQAHQPGGYHPLDGGTSAGLHDDSGIELQEEVERSKVRVTFFQSSKPQSISPPESLHLYGVQNLIQFGGVSLGGGYDNNNCPLDNYITSAALNQQYEALPGHQQQIQQYEDFHPDHKDSTMAAVFGATAVPPAGYNRQISTESGWDNPFRPGGDLSREADEIVNLIKGGKPITPTGDPSLLNGNTPKDSHITDDLGATVVDGPATKLESSQLQATQQNGTKSPHKSPAGGGGAEPSAVAKNGTSTSAAAPGSDASAATNNNSSTTPISNQVIPGPQSASHVVIDEKKKKKCTCCVIQ